MNDHRWTPEAFERRFAEASQALFLTDARLTQTRQALRTIRDLVSPHLVDSEGLMIRIYSVAAECLEETAPKTAKMESTS
jgi:hypothetical protein